MKTQEELNALKEEVKTLNKKLAELTEDELAQVIGGNQIISECEFVNGASGGEGGAITVENQTMNGQGCTFFSNNTVSSGGVIYGKTFPKCDKQP